MASEKDSPQPEDEDQHRDHSGTEDLSSEEQANLDKTIQIPAEESEDLTGTADLSQSEESDLGKTVQLSEEQTDDNADSANLSPDSQENFEKTVQISDESDADLTGTAELSRDEDPDLGKTVQLSNDQADGNTGSSDVSSDSQATFDKTVQLSDESNEELSGTTDLSQESPSISSPSGGQSDLMKTFVDTEVLPGEASQRGPSDNERTVRLDLDSQEFKDILAADEVEGKDRELWAQIASNAMTAENSVIPVGSRSEHSSGMEMNLLLLSRKLQGQDSKLPGMPPDYEIIRQLGRGGMGTVYSARQASLDRSVAIKVIQPLSEEDRKRLSSSGRLEATERTRREQFLSEAVVTGDLDHPNIVPIHDIAKTHEGDLFYSMKQVVGTPWDKVFDEKTFDENLDILMKVADAVAFAHSRGVVHRDLKPENVMLGDFGVVMVMDWGLAVPTPEFKKVGTIRQTTSLGGSPAYMAPELAIGPISRISLPSDIYLLGAILFQIITGQPPHSGSNLSQCIRAAVENRIVEVPKEKQGELYHIAIKAMATQISDRYESVQALQVAIRAYRSHSESISLSERATEDLHLARDSGEYSDFARAVFGYEESLELWNENNSAQRGLVDARLAYADAANQKEDFDLGLSLLTEDEAEYQPMISRLQAGQQERISRRSRLKNLRRVAALLLFIIFVGGGGLSFTIWQKNEELTAAIVSKENADRLKLEAETQAGIANQARTRALAEAAAAELNAKQSIALADETVEKAKVQVANLDLQLETKQREVATAEAHLLKAERDTRYETYVSQISLARTRIEQNQYDEARRILSNIEPKSTWEWKRLWYEVNRSQATSTGLPGNPAGHSVAFSSSGKYAVATFEDGSVEILFLNRDQQESSQQVDIGQQATAAVIAPDENLLAIAGTDGIIRLVDRQSLEILSELGDGNAKGHQNLVTAMNFLSDRWLVSASLDKTVRLWDLESNSEVAVGWHINPVLDLSSAASGEEFLVVTASSDDTVGRAVIWNVQPQAGEKAFEHRGDFLEHTSPVNAVAVSPDANTVASADRTGKIFLWQAEDVQPLDYQQALVAAIESVKENRPEETTSPSPETSVPFIELMDPEIFPGVMHLVSTSLSDAHSGAVDKLRFRSDGSRLVSASDDFTLKVWDISTGALVRTLRGHGGRVQAGAFSPADEDFILSAGNTGLRRWNLALMDEEVIQRPGNLDGDQVRAHQDEIWSAKFDPTGTRLVTASRDHTSRVLEIDPQTLKFKEIASFRDSDAPLVKTGLSILAEGGDYVSLSMVPNETFSRLLVGGSDGMVRVWNVARATEQSVLPNTGLNSSLAMSRDGSLVLTGSSDPKIRAQLWTLDANGHPTGEPRVIADDTHQPVTTFAISPNGSLLFTGGKQGECLIWNAGTGEIVSTIRPHGTSRINAAAFSRDQQELFLASDDRTVSRTNLKTQESQVYQHEGFVTDMALAPDGQHLLSVVQIPRAAAPGSDQSRSESKLLLWNLNEEIPSPVTLWIEPDFGQIHSVRFSFDSSLALTTHTDTLGRKNIVRAWQINGDAASALQHTYRLPKTLAAVECAFPVPGRKMFTLNGDAAFLWDLQSMGHLASYRAHGAVTEADFSPSGKYVTTASRSIKIWDVATQKTICKVEYPHNGAVRSTQFSPVDESIFATGGDDGKVGIWKWDPGAGTAEQIREFALGPGKVHRVRFSSDGTRILAVGEHGRAAVWKTDGTEEPLLLKDDTAGDVDFLCCVISPEQDVIVIGGADRIARLWTIDEDWQGAELLKRFQGHADQITDIALIPGPPENKEARRVVTASRDKSVRIWDPKLADDSPPREILSLRRHTLGVTAIDIARDGNLLMSAGLDGNVILWPCAETENPSEEENSNQRP